MDTHSQTHQNGTGPRHQTEVLARSSRRRFSANYKRSILEEADRCTESGEIGALLRRKGLYSSNLTRWRRQRRHGEPTGAKPGRKPTSEETKELRQLQRENQRLTRKLEQAETIIEVQKNHRVALAPPVCVETLSAVSCAVSEDSGRRVFGGIAPVKKHGPWTAGELESGDAPVRSRLGK